MSHCPSCNTPLPAHARFCGKCGFRFTLPSEVLAYAPDDGATPILDTFGKESGDNAHL